MEPILILLIIGALGGLVRSFLGYNTQADTDESFDYMKMFKSMLRASLVGAAVVMVLIKPDTVVDTAFCVSAFMMAIGADILSKEGYATAAKIAA